MRSWPEAASAESFLTQMSGVALAALCQLYNTPRNDLADDPIWVTESPHELDCRTVGIRHDLDVGRLQYGIAKKWNDRDSRAIVIYQLGTQKVIVQRVPRPPSPDPVCSLASICFASELIIFIPRPLLRRGLNPAGSPGPRSSTDSE